MLSSATDLRNAENGSAVRKAIFARWCGALFYGALGGSLYVLIEWPVGAAIRAVGLVSSTGSATVDVILGLSVVIALAFGAVRLLGFRLAHIRSAWRYPPFLVTALVGCVTFCFLRYIRTQQIDDCAIILTSFCVFVVTTCAIALLPSHQRACASRGSSIGRAAGASLDLSMTPASTPAQLPEKDFLEWLRKEEPIVSASQDYLHMASKARAICRRLQEDPEVSIGIRGPFGSGKTSLTNLVEAQVGSHPHRFIFARVSCWGFETPAKAEEEILASMVRTLGEVGDCLAVRGLPKAYMSRVSVGIPWADSFIAGCCAGGPDDALSALSPILLSLDRHLVVVLEDIDRTSASFDKQQIQALIKRLQDVDRVSLIITANSFTPFTALTDRAAQDVDMHRLCDYLYDLSRFDRFAARAIVRRSHTMALKTAQDDLSAPAGAASRLSWTNLPARFTWMRDWLDELLALPLSMRQLKTALRRVQSAWDVLHGEVLYEELLIVNVLRETYPSALDFISDFHNMLTTFDLHAGSRAGQSGDAAYAAVESLWRRSMGAGAVPEKGLRSMVMHLLPAANADLRAWTPPHQSSTQSMAAETAYLERILSEDLPPEELRDQAVLKAMVAWQRNRDSESLLPAKIAGDDVWASKLEQFAVMLTDQQLLELLSQHLAQLRSLYGKQANSSCPGFGSIWRLGNRRLSSDAALLERLKAEVARSMPVSLWLVFDIFDFWVGSTYMRFQEDDKRAMLRHILGEARTHFLEPSGPQTLFDALPLGWYHTLYHLMRWHENVRYEPERLSGAAAWNFLAEPILLLLEQQPQVMVPHVVILLSKERQREGPDHIIPPYEFDEEFTGAFFGTGRVRAMRALAADVVIAASLEEGLANDVAHARMLAGEWLRANAAS